MHFLFTLKTISGAIKPSIGPGAKGKRTLCRIVLFNFTNEILRHGSTLMNNKVREHNASPLWQSGNPCCFLHRRILFFSLRINNKVQMCSNCIFGSGKIRAFPYVLFQSMQVRSRLCTLCILKFAIRALLYQYLRILPSKMEFESEKTWNFVYKMLMKVYVILLLL